MTAQADRLSLGAGLSCYTANLAGYLASERPDGQQWLAESVRLAVRTDGPDGELAFSHHQYPLDQLPDGTRLAYAGAADGADVIAGLTAELREHGRVLVVADNARLPWSPALGTGPPAPHWLLITGREGPGWQVRDAFTGLLAAGEQLPFAGTLATKQLLSAMRPPPRWSAQQDRRNALAFGFPVPVPPGQARQWLRRIPDDHRPAELAGTWLTDDEAVLSFLAEHLAGHPERAERYLDDLWSAAAHRVFSYRWLADRPGQPAGDRELLTAGADAWSRLPAALRFAVESAARGRPRDSLVTATFEHLRTIELARCAAAARRDPR
jgi:hypothetical protein